MSEAGNTVETEDHGDFVIRIHTRLPIHTAELHIHDGLLRNEFLIVEAAGKAAGKMALIVANMEDRSIARIKSAAVELLSHHRTEKKSKQRNAKICLRLQRGEKTMDEKAPRDVLAERVSKALVTAACDREQIQRAWEGRGKRFKELDPMWDDMAATGSVSMESIEAWLHRVMEQMETFSTCWMLTKRLQKRLVKGE